VTRLLQGSYPALLYISPDTRECHIAVPVRTSAVHHTYLKWYMVGFRFLKCLDKELLVSWCSGLPDCESCSSYSPYKMFEGLDAAAMHANQVHASHGQCSTAQWLLQLTRIGGAASLRALLKGLGTRSTGVQYLQLGDCQYAAINPALHDAAAGNSLQQGPSFGQWGVVKLAGVGPACQTAGCEHNRGGCRHVTLHKSIEKSAAAAAQQQPGQPQRQQAPAAGRIGQWMPPAAFNKLLGATLEEGDFKVFGLSRRPIPEGVKPDPETASAEDKWMYKRFLSE
jgi:hypothetical protein